MKRFYKTAEAGTAPGGFVVRLDGKTLKTPMEHPLIVPTAALAEAMAVEWAAQEIMVVPAAMPMNQLAYTMIDKGRGNARREIEKQLEEYGASDLVCYYAAHPQDLVERQTVRWLPLLLWAREVLGAELETVSGIRYHHQPKAALEKLAEAVAVLEPPAFTAAQLAAGVTGSLVIGLALAHGRVTAEAAFQAACVDEIYQLEKWGADALAQKRLDGIRRELETVELFVRLAGT